MDVKRIMRIPIVKANAKRRRYAALMPKPYLGEVAADENPMTPAIHQPVAQ